MKHGKVKWNQLDAFEKSLTELNRQDSVQVQRMRQRGQPSLWPKIYDKAVRISNRQRNVTPVLNCLEKSHFKPVVNLYPAESLLEEAADKSALYYYAVVVE